MKPHPSPPPTAFAEEAEQHEILDQNAKEDEGAVMGSEDEAGGAGAGGGQTREMVMTISGLKPRHELAEIAERVEKVCVCEAEEVWHCISAVVCIFGGGGGMLVKIADGVVKGGGRAALQVVAIFCGNSCTCA